MNSIITDKLSYAILRGARFDSEQRDSGFFVLTATFLHEERSLPIFRTRDWAQHYEAIRELLRLRKLFKAGKLKCDANTRCELERECRLAAPMAWTQTPVVERRRESPLADAMRRAA